MENTYSIIQRLLQHMQTMRIIGANLVNQNLPPWRPSKGALRRLKRLEWDQIGLGMSRTQDAGL